MGIWRQAGTAARTHRHGLPPPLLTRSGSEASPHNAMYPSTRAGKRAGRGEESRWQGGAAMGMREAQLSGGKQALWLQPSVPAPMAPTGDAAPRALLLAEAPCSSLLCYLLVTILQMAWEAGRSMLAGQLLRRFPVMRHQKAGASSLPCCARPARCGGSAPQRLPSLMPPRPAAPCSSNDGSVACWARARSSRLLQATAAGCKHALHTQVQAPCLRYASSSTSFTSLPASSSDQKA